MGLQIMMKEIRFSAKCVIQSLLPLVRFEGNNFSHVLINRLSRIIILIFFYSIPQVQHLYHSTKVCTCLGGKINKNIPHNYFFFHFFVRLKILFKKDILQIPWQPQLKTQSHQPNDHLSPIYLAQSHRKNQFSGMAVVPWCTQQVVVVLPF